LNKINEWGVTAAPRSSRRARAVVAIAAVATIIISGATNGVAAASPDQQARMEGSAAGAAFLTPETLRVMRQQEALQPAIELLQSEVDKSASSGYMSMGFEGDGVALYWKGELTPGMRRAVGAAQPVGAVTVRPAKHSLVELEAAAARIDAAINPANGGDIQEIVIRSDGSGLDVVKMPPAVAEKVKAKAAAKGARAQLATERQLSDLDVGVPLLVSTADSTIENFACSGACKRRDDTSAWNGGTYLVFKNTPTGNVHCTSGFGVQKGGQTYVLTAAHCGTNEIAYDYVGERVGGIYQENWDKDIMLLNARGSRLIFDGSATTSTTKVVNSYGNQVTNELLCQSGSTSGTICGLKSQSGSYTVNACDSDGDCYNMHSMSKTVQVDGRAGGAPGDSGAPLFSLNGSGVRAKGILSGSPSGNANTIFYQDWNTIGADLGAYPVT
jgi:streptogrisin D